MYSVDGAALGSSLSELSASRGAPRASGDKMYTWSEPAGRTLTVVADASGVTVVITRHPVRAQIRAAFSI